MLRHAYRGFSSWLSPQPLGPVSSPLALSPAPPVEHTGFRLQPELLPAQSHGCKRHRRGTRRDAPSRRLVSPFRPQTAISENTITIFSKTWCPYCKRAKALLASKFADEKTKILEWVSTPFCLVIFTETVIGLTSLTRAPRSRTTWPRRLASSLSPTSSLVSPQDFPILDASHNHCADQKHVGGCDKVVALDSEGKLAGLVKA